MVGVRRRGGFAEGRVRARGTHVGRRVGAVNLGQETRAVRTGSSFNGYHVIARILLAPVSFDLDDPLPMGQYAVPLLRAFDSFCPGGAERRAGALRRHAPRPGGERGEGARGAAAGAPAARSSGRGLSNG